MLHLCASCDQRGVRGRSDGFCCSHGSALLSCPPTQGPIHCPSLALLVSCQCLPRELGQALPWRMFIAWQRSFRGAMQGMHGLPDTDLSDASSVLLAKLAEGGCHGDGQVKWPLPLAGPGRIHAWQWGSALREARTKGRCGDVGMGEVKKREHTSRAG